MGASSSGLRKLRKFSKRQRLGASVPCRPSIRTRHDLQQTLVIVFCQCVTDTSWQCVVALIELFGDRARLHVATDDYDQVRNMGDKNMLKYLNQQLFVHKVDLSVESTVEEFWIEILNMEQTVDVLAGVACVVSDLSVIIYLLQRQPIYDEAYIPTHFDGAVLHMDQLFVKSLEDTRPSLIASSFQNNFFAPMALIKTILPTMKKQRRGKIICINSIAGTVGIPLHAVYCSAKFALEGLLESIAAECIEHCISISIIQTPLDKEQNPAKMIFELPTERNPSLSDGVEERNQLVDETVYRLEHDELLCNLNIHKISKTIKEIIESKESQFRYFVCKRCSNITKEKLKDPKGLSTIKEVAQFFVNSDVC